MSNHKKIYILLTCPDTLPGKLIRYYTKKTYSHVSIALDKDLNEMYSFGRKYMWFPLIGGFIQEDPQKGVFALNDNTLCRLFEVSVSEKQFQLLRNEIESFKRDKERYRYNFLGLAGVMLNRKIVVKDRFFCSQFVAKVLETSEVNLFNKDSEFVTVEDFNVQLEQNALVYEGNLREYK